MCVVFQVRQHLAWLPPFVRKKWLLHNRKDTHTLCAYLPPSKTNCGHWSKAFRHVFFPLFTRKNICNTGMLPIGMLISSDRSYCNRPLTTFSHSAPQNLPKTSSRSSKIWSIYACIYICQVNYKCWLMVIVMLTDADWCWLILTDRAWCWLMLIEAD